MQTNETNKTNKKGKKRKVWPWVLTSVVVIAAAAAFYLYSMGNPKTEAYQAYTVSRGNVETTITGSGTLQANGVENINLPDGVVVSQVLVKAGDIILKGETLATLDYESLVERAAYLSNELTTLDKNISYRDTSQYIFAPVEGRIKYLPVSERDDVVGTIGEQGALAIISADGLMMIEVTTDQELALDTEVTVKWFVTSKTGVVTRKTASGYIVTLTDNGTPYKETAQVYNGDTLIGEGTIEINAPIAVYGNSGTIKEVHHSENTYVYMGSTLFTLKNAVESNSYRLSVVERNEMAEQLQAVLLYMNNPQIIATTEGLVSEVMISDNTETGSGSSTGTSEQSNSGGATGGNAGATAQSTTSTGTTAGSGFSTALTIHTGGAVKMFIDVDELDINSVVLNQEVTVTLDAFPGESYTAKVAHISKLGTATGNITNYPVELSLEYNERFLEGMNGSAVIITERAENVLFIPISAIYEDSTGTYVYTVSGETRRRVDITTGISDGVNAEVTNGLSENDVIQYVDTSSSSIEAIGDLGSSNPFGGGGGSNPFGGGGGNRNPMGGGGQ